MRTLKSFPCKSITITLPEAQITDVEKLIDFMANEANWTYKEEKKSDTRKFSYQSYPLGTFSLSGVQVIEFKIIPVGAGCQVYIDSILKGRGIYTLYDIWGANEKNIDLCKKVFNYYYKNISVNENDVSSHVHEKTSSKFLYILLFIIFCVGVLSTQNIVVIIFTIALGIFLLCIVNERSSSYSRYVCQMRTRSEIKGTDKSAPATPIRLLPIITPIIITTGCSPTAFSIMRGTSKLFSRI